MTNAAALLDLNGFDVTLRIGAGTYTAALTAKTLVGAGKVILLDIAETDATAARAAAEEMARKLLANTVIESFTVDIP